MPRKGPDRTIIDENDLARRLQWERERAELSPAALAARMTEAGCPMSQSSIWKIENAEPRRTVSVAELVAYSRVLAKPLEDLLRPVELVQQERATELIDRLLRLDEQLAAIVSDLFDAEKELAELASEDDALREYVEGHQEARGPGFRALSLDTDMAVRSLYRAVRNAAVATVHNRRNRKK